MVDNGDLRLVMQNNRTLLVSSDALALHSKVFYALIQKSDSKSVKKLELLEDDSRTLQKLCHVLHGQLLRLPKQSSGEALSIVLMASKYDCIEAIVPAAVLWCLKDFNKYNSIPADEYFLLDCLAIAYLLKLPLEFGAASQSLIRWTSGSYNELHDRHKRYRDILPRRVFSKSISPGC